MNEKFPAGIPCGDGSTIQALDSADEAVIRTLVKWDKAQLIEWCMDNGVANELYDGMAKHEEQREP